MIEFKNIDHVNAVRVSLVSILDTISLNYSITPKSPLSQRKQEEINQQSTHLQEDSGLKSKIKRFRFLYCLFLLIYFM